MDTSRTVEEAHRDSTQVSMHSILQCHVSCSTLLPVGGQASSSDTRISYIGALSVLHALSGQQIANAEANYGVRGCFTRDALSKPRSYVQSDSPDALLRVLEPDFTTGVAGPSPDFGPADLAGEAGSGVGCCCLSPAASPLTRLTRFLAAFAVGSCRMTTCHDSSIRSISTSTWSAATVSLWSASQIPMSVVLSSESRLCETASIEGTGINLELVIMFDR